MTRDEAMKLDAGPELDALIATKIMGWVQHSRNTAHWADFDGVDYKVMGWTCGLDRWSPSTDIAAAWQVVEKMHADGWTTDVRVCSIDAGGGCRCTIICNYGPCERHGHTEHTFHGASNVRGDTAPLAICRAALKAVMKD